MAAERKPATATIKVDPELLRKAKQVAALEDVKLQDLFDELLRAPIERRLQRAIRRIRGDAREESE